MLYDSGVSSSDISIGFSGFLVREFDLLLVGVMRKRSLTALIPSCPFDMSVDLEFSVAAAVVAPVSADEVFTVFSRSAASNGEAGRLDCCCAVCDCDDGCRCVEDCGEGDGFGDSGDGASATGARGAGASGVVASVTGAGCSPGSTGPPV